MGIEIIINGIQSIKAELHIPYDSAKKVPLVIISHGFKGSKQWGFFPYISERISQSGSFVLCYNFSLNGDPDKEAIIRNIDEFARNTISQEVSDLRHIINTFTNVYDDEEKWTNSRVIDKAKVLKDKMEMSWNGDIYLLGHSLGGGVSLIASQGQPNVKKIGLWSSIALFDRYTERQKRIWKEQGYMEFTNQRTDQTLRMNSSYIEDIERNKESFDLSKIISELDKEILIIHAKEDVTVPLKEIKVLMEAANRDRLSLEIIEKTGHTFGIDHIFISSTPALERALDKTIKFFVL